MKLTQADKHFSHYIRTKAGWKCERCHKQYTPPTTGLQCSHFQGRAKLATRYEENNAFAHCAGCHTYFGANPYEFVEWAIDKLGIDTIDEIIRLSNMSIKQLGYVNKKEFENHNSKKWLKKLKELQNG